MYKENQITHFKLNEFFENFAIRLLWGKMLYSRELQMTIWRMRIACWVPTATSTYTEFAITIAFPL